MCQESFQTHRRKGLLWPLKGYQIHQMNLHQLQVLQNRLVRYHWMKELQTHRIRTLPEHLQQVHQTHQKTVLLMRRWLHHRTHQNRQVLQRPLMPQIRQNCLLC